MQQKVKLGESLRQVIGDQRNSQTCQTLRKGSRLGETKFVFVFLWLMYDVCKDSVYDYIKKCMNTLCYVV